MLCAAPPRPFSGTRLYTYLNFRNPVDVVWGPGWVASAVDAAHQVGQVNPNGTHNKHVSDQLRANEMSN
eukprot:9477486-Pyramimonas_sp.AAC.2